MANEAAFRELDSMIETIRELPNLAPKMAPAAAQAIGDAVRADLAAGRDPGTGEAWAPTKDGGKPMKGAAGALQVTVAGSKVTLTMGPPYVFHHFGVRGAEARRVLPVRMPVKLGDAVRLGLVRPWRGSLKGAR